MRYSRPRTGNRLRRAGVVAATTALAVAAGAAPAFAADVDFDLDVNAGPQGGGNTVTASASGLLASVTTPGARFVVGANTTCPATYSTTSAGSLTATVTKSDDDTAKIVVPAVALGSTYRVCMYVGTATGSVTQGKTTAIEAYVPEASTVSITPNAANPATTASPVSIVASSSGPWLQNQSTVSAIFTSATCPATYSATGATTATVTKNAANTTATISAPTTLTNGATYNVCYYNGTANTSVLLGKGQYSLVPAVSLSPQFGPSAGTNTLIIQSSTNFMSSGVTAPGVIFTRLACPNTYSNASDYVGASSPLPTKINNMRLSVKVPAGVVLGSSEASAQYKVCVYGGSTAGTSKLIAQPLNYTIAASVTVSSIAPASGPAQGGQEVVITGTNFPTAEGAQVSASLGGSELTNIKVNDLGTTLTGTTTSHAPGATTVSVTTLAGTKSALGTPYAYTYGITVSPNTAPVPASAGANPPIYIQGAGFSNLTPGAAPGVAATTTGAAVYLVDNTWYAGNQASRPVNAGAKAQCYDITVITDNELICTLDLYNGLGTANILGTAPTNTVPVGTYTIAIVNDVAAVGGPVADVGFSRISSGSTFTVASY